MPTRYMLSSSPQADNQLARIWVDAADADRPAITQAADTIDAELREDPDQKGTALPAVSATLRQLVVPPLLAYYEVSVPDRRVRIIDYEQIP